MVLLCFFLINDAERFLIYLLGSHMSSLQNVCVGLLPIFKLSYLGHFCC
jgi:hypothetical protein